VPDDSEEIAAVRLIVRHDLRSPVAVIVGRVDLLLSELQGPVTAAQRKSLESILASAERIDRLAGDLASRIDGLWGAGGAGRR
jgi:signal transduction histidine kinase